jgi:nucleoside diphosphate kinase
VTARRPATVGEVLAGVNWERWSVILLKPDCVRRGLVEPVLERIAEAVDVSARQQLVVADWQIHVHYWDMLVGADWFDRDIPACLRKQYIDRPVVVALAHGPAGVSTPKTVRDMLGHFDPSRAEADTIRGDLGNDSLAAAEAYGRLIDNLVHASDDATATCRDFGTWYGASQHRLLAEPPPVPRPARTRPAAN